MTTSISGSSDYSGSATIYTFPPRGRFALRDDGQNFVSAGFAPAASVQLPRGVKLVSGGSGWYHDAAIQESGNEQGRKN
jgi:hypothetical protein